MSALILKSLSNAAAAAIARGVARQEVDRRLQQLVGELYDLRMQPKPPSPQPPRSSSRSKTRLRKVASSSATLPALPASRDGAASAEPVEPRTVDVWGRPSPGERPGAAASPAGKKTTLTVERNLNMKRQVTLTR